MSNDKNPEKDEHTGRFLPGNKFWMARSSHGARPKFSSPEDLLNACCEYFDWVDSNPLYEDKLVTFQGAATHEPVAKMRPMTLGGLCIFLDVTLETWTEWRKTRADLSDVITRAESIIYQQKFAGAAADLLNANIIARELGLADKQDVNHSGTIGTLSDDAVDARIAKLLGKAGTVDASGGEGEA
ncbi:DNA-packaging protein [Sinorhizobium fredii]|uniref:DNA-packaging protein n=1 Tax=Rhizobium fredii TaxID=380 RepID=UPI0009B6031E|nr:DNA-packaging protein [Sinorhizobium fredii]